MGRAFVKASGRPLYLYSELQIAMKNMERVWFLQAEQNDAGATCIPEGRGHKTTIGNEGRSGDRKFC